MHRARLLSLLLPVGLALTAARCAGPAENVMVSGPTAPSRLALVPAAADTATFAMGCFWCAETAFEGMDGVASVVSGFTGGSSANPTYDEVSAGGTGHYEVIQIVYDPAQVGYERLLDVFWHNVDPLDAGGQFCDRGDQYRAAVFAHGAEQRRLAESTKAAFAGRFDRPVVTEILPASAFTAAEDYHQDFWLKSPERYTQYRTGCGRDARLAELWGAPSGASH